ncbi:MAG TPA: hypothetical protein VLB44_20280 [Kofleriaceae bacterium]|nr:hypothetical protein [Kofleriaceae bacterium]
MRALLLVLAVVAACDAGAKPEPAKHPLQGSAEVTDCKAVVAVLQAAAVRDWIKEPPPPKPSEASVRSLEAACARWPESFKACVVASTGGGDLAGCMTDRPELIDELLLGGFDVAIRTGSAAPTLDTSGSGR